MKRFAPIANTLFVAIVLLAHVRLFARPTADKIDSAVTAYVRLQKFSGTVLVAHNGNILLARGYGQANYELGVPNTSQTKYRLGSLTKQFTATAIMQLQERGLLGVHDPLSKYLPGYPNGDAITIHHLLSHTSGIANYTAIEKDRTSWRTAATLQELIDKFRDVPASFKPGESYEYSNSNYVLLTLIIEKVSGEPYEQYVQQHIFDPLGMKESGYDHAQKLLANRAAGYTLSADGLANAEYIDMSVPSGAGALYSTVEDLYKWDRALYTEKLLKKSSLDAMFTPVSGYYGYGWAMVNKGRRQIQHSGGVNGFATFIARYPDDDVCIIVLGNFEHGEPADVGATIASIVFGEPYKLPSERVVAKVDPAVYARHIGEYELAPGFVITVTTGDGKLYAQATGQSKFEIYPESDVLYFLTVVDAQIEFRMDDKGATKELVLYQGGRATPGKKVR